MAFVGRREEGLEAAAVEEVPAAEDHRYIARFLVVALVVPPLAAAAAAVTVTVTVTVAVRPQRVVANDADVVALLGHFLGGGGAVERPHGAVYGQPALVLLQSLVRAAHQRLGPRLDE